jgi:hypothetical protein
VFSFSNIPNSTYSGDKARGSLDFGRLEDRFWIGFAGLLSNPLKLSLSLSLGAWWPADTLSLPFVKK